MNHDDYDMHNNFLVVNYWSDPSVLNSWTQILTISDLGKIILTISL
jgi:hypothetical protein